MEPTKLEGVASGVKQIDNIQIKNYENTCIQYWKMSSINKIRFGFDPL